MLVNVLVVIGVIVGLVTVVLLMSLCVVSSINNEFEEELFQEYIANRENDTYNKSPILFEKCDDQEVTLEDCLVNYLYKGKEVVLSSGKILGWTL